MDEIQATQLPWNTEVHELTLVYPKSDLLIKREEKEHSRDSNGEEEVDSAQPGSTPQGKGTPAEESFLLGHGAGKVQIVHGCFEWCH